MELFVIVFLFGVVFADDCRNIDLRRIDSIRPEPECSSAGGLCVIAADCPLGQLAEKPGLCPSQQNAFAGGVECCYGISVKETRCQKRGGECFFPSESRCMSGKSLKQATDCPPGSRCCVMH